MDEKAVIAIRHVTTAALADDSETAVVEFDKAGELIDELVQERQDGADGREGEARADQAEDGEPEEEDQEEEAVTEDQPEAHGPENEEGGVRAKVSEKARTMRESVSTPQTPFALAAIGVVAGLAAFGAVRALSGAGEQ